MISTLLILLAGPVTIGVYIVFTFTNIITQKGNPEILNDWDIFSKIQLGLSVAINKYFE